MARKSTIKLLLINKSDNECERLISLFRNSGRVARAHRAKSAEDLHANLEKDCWDLIISDEKHPEITTEQCLEQLKKRKSSLPLIAVRDKNQQAILDAGASDVIGTKDDHRLISAALREIGHFHIYNTLSQTQSKLKEAEERCELLLAQSQDAIAYCADGMIINANTLFCNYFGYDDPDDLDCLPIIDLIDDKDHDKIKNLLKIQLANTDSENTIGAEFTFTGVQQNAEVFSATMQLSNAVFDDESCIQLSVRDEKTGGQASGSDSANTDKDSATGLYNHDYFLGQLRSAAQQTATGNTASTLLFIGIDCFTNFRSKWGITHAYNVVLNIACFIQEHASDASSLAHFCDDGFTLLLPETSAEKSLDFAEKLCHDLEEHIIEIDSQSIQCTASIGLVILSKPCQQDPNILVEQAFSACEQVRTDARNKGVGNGAHIYVPSREIKSLGNAEGDEDLDTTLAEALEDEQFILTYQPIVSLRGTSGDHYEVHAVLINDNDEEIEAEQYLKSMEFTTPNTRLDRWIIIEATKQLAEQQSSRNDTRLFINLTANALLDQSLIPWLSVALKAGGTTPDSLIFQFLESDIANCLKPAKTFAEAVKSLGCRLSISQFGKASDPYKTLKHVGANFAKISSHLTEELQSSGDTQILKAMVSSINEYEAEAIISNVENASALAILWQLGVDYIQGSYLAVPTKAMDYEFTDIA